METIYVKTLAIIHLVDGWEGSDADLREKIWAQTVGLLQPILGKYCGRFEPEPLPWSRAEVPDYGVILGRRHPAHLLRLYQQAREEQERAVRYHLREILENCRFNDSAGEGKVAGVGLEPKPGKEDAVTMHVLWNVEMMLGEVFPDAGIYYYPTRQAVLSEELNKRIIEHVEDYALSQVRLYRKTEAEPDA